MKGQITDPITCGNVWKTLLMYSLPLLGSAMVQQAYSLADLLIVGNFAQNGQIALTAVGEASTMVNILLAFALGCNGGCSVIVAKYFGAKNNLKVRETVNTALISFAVMCAAVMALGFGLAKPSMYVLDIKNGEILNGSLTYLYIYLGSLPFVFLYNIGCGVCSALGDSKMPFLFLVFSSVVNVGLDFLFVCAFHWDVAGAAWATFISQAAATALTVFVLLRKLKGVETEEKPAKFSKQICKDLVVTSIPILLESRCVGVGTFFVPEGRRRVRVAAGQFGRIRTGYLAVLTYAMATSIVFLALCEIIPRPLTMVFIENPTEEAVNCSVEFLRIVSAFLPAVCIKIVSDGAVRGCGGNLGFTISTFTDLILRVAFVYILVGSLGFSGVCWAWTIGWSVSMCIAIGFYIAIPCLRRKKSTVQIT